MMLPRSHRPPDDGEERLLRSKAQKLSDTVDLEEELLRGLPLRALLAGRNRLFENSGAVAREDPAGTYALSKEVESLDFFVSHCTKDDSLNVFEKVSTYMDAKDKKIFNPTTHLSHVKHINKAAMQGAVKRSTVVVASWAMRIRQRWTPSTTSRSC